MERVLSFLRQLECNNNKAQLLICLEERRRKIIIHQEGGDNYESINQVMLSSFSHQG